jgi:hypothetical protein
VIILCAEETSEDLGEGKRLTAGELVVLSYTMLGENPSLSGTGRGCALDEPG